MFTALRRSGLAAGIVVALLPLAAPAAHAGGPTAPLEKSVSLSKEAGGGNGAWSRSFTASNATMSLTGTGEWATLEIDAGDDRWRIQVAAPRDEKLAVRTYHEAERASSRTGRSPGLEVDGAVGCNEVWGDFAIHQIEVTEDGTVRALEADFTHRCEGPEAPALRGTIRYDVRALSYGFTSEPGHWVGQGLTREYRNARSVFQLYGNVEHGIQFRVSGQREEWTVSFSPRWGEVLKPGTYTDAIDGANQSHPSISVGGENRGCTDSGSFTIHHIDADPDGEVIALHATFEHRCDARGAALRGTIRYQA